MFFVSGVAAYLIFVHYAAYLTATTTSGTTDSAIKSFDDVIKGGYKVIVMGSTSNIEYLKESRPGTAMHEVYYGSMVGNPRAFVQSLEEAEERMSNDGKTLFFSGNGAGSFRNPVTVLDLQGLQNTLSLLSFWSFIF